MLSDSICMALESYEIKTEIALHQHHIKFQLPN